MTMNRLWYGGDYNPEQWSREVWGDDLRLMKRAGVTVVTVGVFAWSLLEPEDGVFDFSWLDDVLDGLHTAGVRVDLATATASPPAWLVEKHPEILPVTAEGVVLGFGSRQSYSPSSRAYRRHADRLVRALAERYGNHPALEAWHVNNELACHIRHDYSDESAVAFRSWLAAKYGTIDALNEAWGTVFWSQRYGSFAQVQPPRAMPTLPNPTQALDWDRFSSDAWLGVFRAEAEILRELTPHIPITTNFMGFFIGADYWSWATEMDFISDDHYVDPADPAAPAYAAMTRDLMRSLGRGAPWILMEQSTSAVNWRPRNAPKPPGMHRALSLQAVARGADGIMQFQWRQSRSGAEKFHSAMVPHAGELTRVFRETTALGAEIAALSALAGTRLRAKTAILFDWDSWWAHDQGGSPSRLDYVSIVFRWYRELWRRGILVDFARPGSDLGEYDLVVAPAAIVLSAGARRMLDQYVREGGRLVMTYQSGILDENLGVLLDGYLGELQSTLGLRIEEFAPAAEPSMTGGPVPELRISGLAEGPAHSWGEVVLLSGAEALAWFEGGMLNGMPAITRHAAGAGTAWYVATEPENIAAVFEEVLAGWHVAPHPIPPDGVEIVERGTMRFIINHTAEPVDMGEEVLGPLDASVISAPSRAVPAGTIVP